MNEQADLDRWESEGGCIRPLQRVVDPIQELNARIAELEAALAKEQKLREIAQAVGKMHLEAANSMLNKWLAARSELDVIRQEIASPFRTISVNPRKSRGFFEDQRAKREEWRREKEEGNSYREKELSVVESANPAPGEGEDVIIMPSSAGSRRAMGLVKPQEKDKLEDRVAQRIEDANRELANHVVQRAAERLAGPVTSAGVKQILELEAKNGH